MKVPEYGATERYYPEYGGGLFAMHLARYEYVKNFVNNKTILDFGCGEGYGTALLSKVGKFVVGSDYNREVLYRAMKKYGPDINFVVSNCMQSCFKDGTFDVIVSFEVIEHMKDINSYLGAIRKIMKDDGVFYLSTPNRSVQEKARKNKQEKSHFHHRELNDKELKELLKKYFKEVQLLGQMRKVKNSLYNFIKMIDWFNLRHIIFPLKVEKGLIRYFYSKDIGSNPRTDFVITNRIIHQAAVLIAICKKPKKDYKADW